jgi:L-fuconolactonase
MRIDSHQHFWHYDDDEYEWIEEEELESLERDFMPGDLTPLMEETGIEGTVLVQARQKLAETAWLLELADEHEFIRGVVGWVDIRASDLRAQLTPFGRHPKLCGVRHVLHDEPDDLYMLHPDFLRGLATVYEFGLTYDLLIRPRHLRYAIELVGRLPRQQFVLDHIAKPPITSGELEPWATQIRQLAEAPNVYCKVSGLIAEADPEEWAPEDFRPYLDVVFGAFGTERLMFGSNWPVCTVAATYEQVVSIVSEYMADYAEDEVEAVFGGNAARFYKLPDVEED